jgi:hypothetical protein
MHDARDAEDKRLLEAGEYERLLENYVYLVREWTLVRLRDREAADEVSQRVFLRLLRELRAGKRYVVPFRVVVWKVVDFMCLGYEWGTTRRERCRGWDPEAPDAFAAGRTIRRGEDAGRPARRQRRCSSSSISRAGAGAGRGGWA